MDLETNVEGEWKNKYSTLLEEIEAQGSEREITEKLLCRTIIRLTLAVNGLDPALDPHLKKLRTLLKSGVRSDQLRKQVDAVSEVLLRAGESEVSPDVKFDATILFEFLRHCALGDVEISAIKKLEHDYLSNRFDSLNSLFTATSELLNEEGIKASKPTLFKRLFSRPEKGDFINQGQKRLLLSRLIDGLDAPTHLQDELELLKQQAEENGENSPQFFTLLENFISLLNQAKSNRSKEQEEIDAFLFKVTTQLERLEGDAEGVRRFVKESSRANKRLNKNVSGNVSDIKLASDDATTLGGLREAITTKLDTITAELEAHLNDTESRAEKAEQENHEMSLTIKEMEAESICLKAAIKLNRDRALSDGLTGVPNRQAYNERIEGDFLRWKRFGEPLTLLVWDIDHFKDVNDRFGHQAGDLVLKEVANIIASNLRETDFVARYGGEEFVMLMLGASKEEVLQKANSIREKIKARGFNSNGKPLKVTASCGLTQFTEADGSHEAAFERADKAMYEAKNGGRDRCVLG